MYTLIRTIALGIILFGVFDSIWSTAPPKRVVQVSGVLVDHEDLQPVPFAHLSVLGTNRLSSADDHGFFSIVVYVGDSIRISCIGYESCVFHIPDSLSSNRYTLFQSLRQDTLELPVAVIYPWPSKDRFRDAFLNLKVPDDDYEIARKNLTLAEFKERARYGKMDANMNYRNYIQKETDKLYYAGQPMPNNLLNPFAWMQFLNIWKQQRDSRKSKKDLEWDDE